MQRFKLFVVFLLLVLFIIPVQAREVPEHSFIRPFPNSVLATTISKHDSFNSYEFYYMNETNNKREKKLVKGEYWRLIYEVRTASGDRVQNISKLEFFENYKAAAEQRGGKVVFQDAVQMILTIPRDDGGITWLRVAGNAGLGQQDLIIIDEEPFKQSLTFGPKALKEALDKDGRVILYEILFDYDKASLQQKSDKQLQHVLTLLMENPELKLEIQGHTDNKGEDAYNLTLSQQRAETVRRYLALFGIPPEQLTSKGYGEAQPVATNDTEEGRAKNRRVELVKMDVRSSAQQTTTVKDVAQIILGEWQIAENGRAKSGMIIFNSNGLYEMDEKLQDGDRVGTKGGYKLNQDTSPYTIDLCVGQCGAPGSEWTTRFGILRVISNDKIEIRTSPDGNYPVDFSVDPTDKYYMILNR